HAHRQAAEIRPLDARQRRARYLQPVQLQRAAHVRDDVRDDMGEAAVGARCPLREVQRADRLLIRKLPTSNSQLPNLLAWELGPWELGIVRIAAACVRPRSAGYSRVNAMNDSLPPRSTCSTTASPGAIRSTADRRPATLVTAALLTERTMSPGANPASSNDGVATRAVTTTAVPRGVSPWSDGIAGASTPSGSTNSPGDESSVASLVQSWGIATAVSLAFIAAASR